MSEEKMLANDDSRQVGSDLEDMVRRFGPLVLRVCRTILGNIEQAEDTFQATVLDLVRRTCTIRRLDSLDGWLYAVASRNSRRERERLSRFQLSELLLDRILKDSTKRVGVICVSQRAASMVILEEARNGWIRKIASSSFLFALLLGLRVTPEILGSL